MAIKRGNKYLCPICFKAFPNANFADTHRDSEHDIVYIPMERSEVGRFVQYIYTKDDSLLPVDFVLRLKDVMKKSTRITKEDDI